MRLQQICRTDWEEWMDMRREIFGIDRRNGFSLVELLIVLAVIAALIAVVTPIGINAMRKSQAVSVAKDLMTLSKAFAGKIYLDGELPQTINELGRNVSKNPKYGIAWTAGEEREYVIFSNAKVDVQSLRAIITSATSSPFPDLANLEYLSGGLPSDSDELTVYYSFSLGSSGAVESGKLTSLGSTFQEIIPKMIDLIDTFQLTGRVLSTWKDTRYTDLGLNPDEWSLPVNKINYSPRVFSNSSTDNIIIVTPATGYDFRVTYTDGGTSRDNNWWIFYSAEHKKWYHRDYTREVDITKLEIIEEKKS
jgi:general secretion pathway protein G